MVESYQSRYVASVNNEKVFLLVLHCFGIVLQINIVIVHNGNT